MRTSHYRFLFGMLLLGSILGSLSYMAVTRAKIDEQPAIKLKGTVDGLEVTSRLMQQNRFQRNPRDYVSSNESTCMNSWRVIHVDIVSPRPEDDPYEPELESCWSSSANDLWDDRSFKHFSFSSNKDTPRAERYTQIMAIVGADAPFTEFLEGHFKTVFDLPKNAIFMVEVSQQEVPWMQAGDVELSDLKAAAKRQDLFGSGVSTSGRWVAFADGTIWFLDKSTPISVILPFCTVEGAKKHDRNRELGQYKLREYIEPR